MKEEWRKEEVVEEEEKGEGVEEEEVEDGRVNNVGSGGWTRGGRRGKEQREIGRASCRERV